MALFPHSDLTNEDLHLLDWQPPRGLRANIKLFWWALQVRIALDQGRLYYFRERPTWFVLYWCCLSDDQCQGNEDRLAIRHEAIREIELRVRRAKLSRESTPA